jgi:hypothetical protein
MRNSDIIYGPHARVRLLPAVMSVCLALSVCTFVIAYYDINGLREPAGYGPAGMFFAFASIFFVVFWRKLVRITLGAEGVAFERLFPRPRRAAFVRYSEIGSIEQARLSLKLSLLSREGRVLLVIPEAIERVSGEFSPVRDSSIPADVQPPLLEIYQLRQEIALRAGLIK